MPYGYEENKSEEQMIYERRRGEQALKKKFEAAGQTLTNQDIKNYIDPSSGKVWGGLWDSLDADLAKRNQKPSRSSSSGSHSSSGGHGSQSVSSSSVQSSRDSARGQVANIKEFGPELAEHYIQVLKDLGPEYAQTQYDIISGIFPEMSTVGESAAGIVNKRLQAGPGVPDELASLYRQYRKEADSDRGLLKSGFSSESESLGLSKMAFDIQAQDINSALSFNAQTPKPAFSPVLPGSQGPVWNDYFGASLAAQTNLNIAGMNDATRRELGFAEIGLAQQKLGIQSDALSPNDPWGNFLGQVGGSFAGQAGSQLTDQAVDYVFN